MTHRAGHIVAMGGGGFSMKHLLALWRVHGLDRLLREAWRNGAVLAGISAGMLCWFEAGITDSFGPLQPLHDGLGWLEGSACPHYDGEVGRRPLYRKLVGEGFPAGLAADDGAAFHFVGTDLEEVVSSRRTAGAYEVTLQEGQVAERRLTARFLGE